MMPNQPNTSDFDPRDYAIEVCSVCGAQLDGAHGAANTLRCAVREHGRHGAMIVRVVARPDAEQTHWSYKSGVVNAT